MLCVSVVYKNLIQVSSCRGVNRLLSCNDRNFPPEGRSFYLIAICADLSSVQVNENLLIGKTDAAAILFGIALVEAGEKLGDVYIAQTRAFVADADTYL